MPEIATRLRVGGIVYVESVIDANGIICAARVLRAQPGGDIGAAFSRNALACVRQWRFQPARRNGKPVPVLFSLTVQFKV
jgi:TonB family protein